MVVSWFMVFFLVFLLSNCFDLLTVRDRHKAGKSLENYHSNKLLWISHYSFRPHFSAVRKGVISPDRCQITLQFLIYLTLHPMSKQKVHWCLSQFYFKKSWNLTGFSQLQTAEARWWVCCWFKSSSRLRFCVSCCVFAFLFTIKSTTF